MNIGEAAKASNVSAKMIRHYEHIGLISPAARSDAGYRSFGERDVHTLRFIRSARDLGFTVEGIGELLGLWQDRSRHSADVKKVALAQIEKLEQKITELQAMRNTLQTLVTCCSGDQRPDCPILENLAIGQTDIKPVSARRFGVPGER